MANRPQTKMPHCRAGDALATMIDLIIEVWFIPQKFVRPAAF
jgi:hypothetical protein